MSRHLLYAGLFLLTLSACSESSTDGGALNQTANTPAQSALQRYDAELIYADFAAGDIPALKKYQHQAFLLTGRLQKMQLMAEGRLLLELKAAAPDKPVRAWMKPDDRCLADTGALCARDTLAALPRGFKVYLECQHADIQDALPTAHDCTLTGGFPKAD